MSANDYIAIAKEGRKYIGYHCCADLDETMNLSDNPIAFTATSLKDAIKKAQSQEFPPEYGYEFVNL